MVRYSKKEYWEERYSKETEPFDWYQRWSSLKESLSEYLDFSFQVLYIGCGTSKLPEDMLEEGFTSITCIDQCENLISALQEKHQDKESLTFQCMDARSLEFEDSQFDCVIDKATLDSVCCGETAHEETKKLLEEVVRTLKPGGIYIVVSYAEPKYRDTYLKQHPWEVTVHQVEKSALSSTGALVVDDEEQPNVHYVYVCKKPQET